MKRRLHTARARLTCALSERDFNVPPCNTRSLGVPAEKYIAGNQLLGESIRDRRQFCPTVTPSSRTVSCCYGSKRLIYMMMNTFPAGAIRRDLSSTPCGSPPVAYVLSHYESNLRNVKVTRSKTRDKFYWSNNMCLT